MTCAQYLKKIEHPEPPDPDSPHYYMLHTVSKEEADAFIRAYEYLGTVGHPVARYGAHDPLTGRMAAVATFGRPTFTGPPGVIVLERGASAPWAHPHTASWFINRACRAAALDHGWHTFVAYADPAADEIGTVYQASGWSYMGQGRERGRRREYFRQGDRLISEHAFRARGLTIIDAQLGEWERVFVPAKHRYQWSPDRRRRAEFKKLALPYPKRS
jgi:hypothetical protein